MTAPDIKTPLPGPRAADLIARDARHVSPSYTRGYPLVMAGGQGRRGRGRGRQPLPRLRRRYRRERDGALASRGGQGDRRPGAAFPAHVGHRLLLRAASAPRGGDGVDCADGRAGPVVLWQLRNRGGRGFAEARQVVHEAAQHHRLPRIVPWPDDGRAVADVEQGPAAKRIRPDGARRVPCAVRELLSLSGEPAAGHLLRRVRGRDRGADPGAPRLARRSRRNCRRADPGRGRLRGAAGGVSSSGSAH